MGMLHLPDAATPVSRASHRPLLNSAHVAFTTIALFSVFGSNFLRNLLGWYGFSAIIVALSVWFCAGGSFVRPVCKRPRCFPRSIAQHGRVFVLAHVFD